MIEEFSFGNFRSFKDIQTLKMTAAKIKSKNPTLDIDNIFPVQDNLNLLKSKAIYGANASGKSNVIDALRATQHIILHSVKDKDALLIINSFELSTQTIDEPTFSQIIFRIDGVRYRYGFVASDKSIKSEWLFSTPKKREQTLFLRETEVLTEVNQTHFDEGVLYQKLFKNTDKQVFTPTSLFLTHLASTGFGVVSRKIMESLSSIIILKEMTLKVFLNFAGSFLEETIRKKFILEFLKKADVGITNLKNIEINTDDFPEYQKENLGRNQLIVSSRTRYNKNLEPDGENDFSFDIHESEGTKKMFELSPHIFMALNHGTTLIIDEFDARLHPLLTRKIIELFNSSANKKNAQLIFTTHDTNLLSSEILRRDQIDFVEKDKYGASHLYTLVEIKGVRNDASFEKDYIQGKYGAIPFLGDFSNLIDAD